MLSAVHPLSPAHAVSLARGGPQQVLDERHSSTYGGRALLADHIAESATTIFYVISSCRMGIEYPVRVV
jgi:hypothetical protein